MFFEKLCYVLNCVLKFIDFVGKFCVKCMLESFGILIEIQLLDGGKVILVFGDYGQLLVFLVFKNLFCWEIVKFVKSFVEFEEKLV